MTGVITLCQHKFAVDFDRKTGVAMPNCGVCVVCAWMIGQVRVGGIVAALIPANFIWIKTVVQNPLWRKLPLRLLDVYVIQPQAPFLMVNCLTVCLTPRPLTLHWQEEGSLCCGIRLITAQFLVTSCAITGEAR